MVRVNINSGVIKEAADNIAEQIEEIKQIAGDIEKMLSSNRQAYGEGDVDAKSIESNVEDINQTLAQSVQQLAANIELLKKFADAMEQTALK